MRYFKKYMKKRNINISVKKKTLKKNFIFLKKSEIKYKKILLKVFKKKSLGNNFQQYLYTKGMKVRDPFLDLSPYWSDIDEQEQKNTFKNRQLKGYITFRLKRIKDKYNTITRKKFNKKYHPRYHHLIPPIEKITTKLKKIRFINKLYFPIKKNKKLINESTFNKSLDTTMDFKKWVDFPLFMREPENIENASDKLEFFFNKKKIIFII